MPAIDSLSKFVVWGIVHRCENDTHVVLLDECLASIRQIYRWHHIIIVDSDSPKKDHFLPLCEKYNAVVAQKINRNYECGAWKIVYEECQASFYCFIHDSCKLTKPLGETLNADVAPYQIVYNHPRNWCGEVRGLRARVIASLQGTKWSVPECFWTLIGNIFFAKTDVVARLHENGFFNELPTNKFEACCWERRLGICLCQEGYADALARNCVGAWPDGQPAWHKLAKQWLNRQ